MRVRLIRPAYWTDADLHTRLTAEQREFYIGLWMVADDAGYIRWDVDRIGAELYPYRSAAWRTKRLPSWLVLLDGHVKRLECGRHVVVVRLPTYQKPPKPSAQYKREHEDLCHLLAPAGASGDHGVGPAQGFSNGFSREGKEVEGGAAAPTEFQERYAAAEAAIGAMKHRADH